MNRQVARLLYRRAMRTEVTKSLMAIAIIVMAIAMALLISWPVKGRAADFYDNRGKLIGRSTTDTQGTTTFYGADGRVQGKASDIQGGTNFYGADGKLIGKKANPTTDPHANQGHPRR